MLCYGMLWYDLKNKNLLDCMLWYEFKCYGLRVQCYAMRFQSYAVL